MNKNIQFHIMSFCNSLVFFAPVAILLRTTKGVTVSQFFLLQALLSIGIVLFEIPTGMLADRIGYKKTLLLSQIMLFVARVLFLIADSLGYFVIEAILEAISCCFISGTADAYLYEWCKQSRKEENFIQENARAKAWGTAGFLVSTVGYSILYKVTSLNGLVIATELATLVSIVSVMMMPESRKETAERMHNFKHSSAKPHILGIFQCQKFKNIVYSFILLETIVGVERLIVNFLYAEKLNWIGIPLTWMTPVILCYSILELFVPSVISILKMRNEIRMYQMFSLLGAGMLFGIFLLGNVFCIIFMIAVPFVLGIVETIQYKYENEYIDKFGQSENRATLLSIINMGNNLFSVIFLLLSAVVTSEQGNLIFLFAASMMFVVAVLGSKVCSK